MPVELGVRLARVLGVTAEYLVDGTADEPALDDESRYLLRVIADAGLSPGDVARNLLRTVNSPLRRPGEPAQAETEDPGVSLDILAPRPTASIPDASAPPARARGKPRTG